MRERESNSPFSFGYSYIERGRERVVERES